MKHRPADEFRMICEALGDAFFTIAGIEDRTGIDPDTIEGILKDNPQTFHNWTDDTYSLVYWPPPQYSEAEMRSDYYRCCGAFDWLPSKALSAYMISSLAEVPVHNVAYIVTTRPDTFAFHGMVEDMPWHSTPVVSYIEDH